MLYNGGGNMVIGVSFIICSLIYMLLLCIVYFSKKRIKTIETKIYSLLLVLNVIGLILELICCLTVSHMDVVPILNVICNRAYLIYFATFISLFTLYIYITCNNYNLISKSKKLLFIVIYVLLILCVLIFPLKYYYDSNAVYSYGLAASSLMVVSLLFIIIDFICVFKNLGHLFKKKIIPMIALLIFFIIAFIIRNINPGIILITCSFALVTAIMYFTIENPDVKMIEQLSRNKKLIEQGNEDKSNFLFRMSQEVKKPIDDIIRINSIISNTNDLEIIKRGIKYIDYNSKELKFFVNNVLDVTKMDTYNIKMVDSVYNVYNIFVEMFARYESMIDKKINFRYSISKNIPEVLYGDSVKLKQIVTTILDNAINHTKEGFIDINVDSIVKNDICRLIISIEDSGNGMSLDKVNELLSISNDLSEQDIKKLDKMNLDLNIATKIIKLLGGQIIIKSQENIGSQFIVAICQKIKGIESIDNFDDYMMLSSNKKKILIVDNKKNDLDVIISCLKKYDVEVIKSMYGMDCVERINKNQKYDLILIDDEMEPITGFNTFEKLRLIKHFKTPTVIMLDKSKEGIKHHYLKEGFKDYLLKDDMENEIKRIIKIVK